jgi:hypothetical protein
VIAIGGGWFYVTSYNTDTSTAAVTADCEKAVASGEYTAGSNGDATAVGLCIEDTFKSLPVIDLALIFAISSGIIGLIFLAITIVILRKHLRRETTE